MARRRPGLTMIETMIATLMLGVGLVAIASLFPVAGSIQRKTYDAVVVRQVSDSVSGLVEARGFSALDMVDVLNPLDLLSFQVRPMPQKVLDASHPIPAILRWGLADRCYPSAMSGDPACTNRGYYWVPLVRRVNLVDWHIYVFILKREEGVTYSDRAGAANAFDPDKVPAVRSVPVVNLGAVDELGNSTGLGDLVGSVTGPLTGGGSLANRLLVVNAPDHFQPGDLVLDSQGVPHTVIEVEENSVTVDGLVSPLVTELWYAPRPPGVECPTRKILIFGNGVVLQ
jgi:hypothetical protein